VTYLVAGCPIANPVVTPLGPLVGKNMAQAVNTFQADSDLTTTDQPLAISLPSSPSKPLPDSQAPKVKPTAYFSRKELAERVLAGIMLIPSSILILGLVVLVRLTSRGPGIYCQERVGRNGKRFMMYKIRTMRANAEENTGAVWSPQSDPRITLIGRILRRLHLDEFPQLFNVMRGDMSLIGPRPERPEFVEILDKKIPGYALRHKVKPGITGLAQINLPPDVNLNCVRRKLKLDLEYIGTARFSLDFRMFLCSSLALTGIPGHVSKKVLKLKRTVQLPPVLEPQADHRDAA